MGTWEKRGADPDGGAPPSSGAQALLAGRTSFERHAWQEAYASLMEADTAAPLDAEDLELLARAAALTGRDREMLRALERAYALYVEQGACARAARAAFWMGFRLLAMGEMGQGGGWIARSQRLVDREAGDCAERGYLLLPLVMRSTMAGDWPAAQATAAQAAAIGERFADADLVAFARQMQGRALLKQGQLPAGLALLDEVMVAAASGELSPLMTGLVYCGGIAACHQVYALDRAREWTAALSAWCQEQPQLVTFTGTCLVHRSEILQIGGAWSEAIAEAERAGERCVPATDPQAAASACYQRAEIHRLRGEFEAAEVAYRRASQYGLEPQPGLALLRLAEGQAEVAASAIRRVVAATSDPVQRTRFLPAHVEIMLAVGDLDAARAARHELGETAARLESEVLGAIAAHAEGAIRLVEGQAASVLAPARHAFDVWQRLGAPYLAARVRVLIARADRALGDDEGGALELEAAREVFARLGARPDLAMLEALAAGLPPVGEGREASAAAPHHGLTPRELEVLRLVAQGKTNKAIAAELTLSEKTVDRHLSNIFTKIDVASRAAATAYAYEHGLI